MRFRLSVTELAIVSELKRPGESGRLSRVVRMPMVVGRRGRWAADPSPVGTFGEHSARNRRYMFE